MLIYVYQAASAAFTPLPPSRRTHSLFTVEFTAAAQNGAYGTSERCKGSWKEALQGQTIDPPRRAPPPMFGTGTHNFRGNLLFSLALPLAPLSFTPFFYPPKCQQTFFFFANYKHNACQLYGGNWCHDML